MQSESNGDRAMINDAFSIYRILSILFSKNIHFFDMLLRLGISEVCIYGMGEMGCVLSDDLTNYGTIKVVGTYDKKRNGSLQVLRENNCPIIITPVGCYSEIRTFLEENGIDTQRLLSISQIIVMSEYVRREGWKNYRFGTNKEFLVIGANFDNKGSEAMTFVAIKELRSRYKDCIIWFNPNFQDEIYRKNDYKMIVLDDGYGEGSICHEIMPRLAGIIDVSGYCVSSEKGFGDTERTLDYLKMAYRYDIPYYFMPQSFGPINYPEYKLMEMRVLFSSAKVIYAREKEGKQLLEEKLGLNNVRQSTDMVLQSSELNESDVYYKKNIVKNSGMTIGNNGVAIIPNSNFLRYYSMEELVGFYSIIINYLIGLDKSVHIVPHSCDAEMCMAIYHGYEDNSSVYIHDDPDDCFSFSELIEDADFVIASRYHALVHAFKLNIPCIAIGWADKYGSLLSDVGQEEYLIDAREGIDAKKVMELIDRLKITRNSEVGVIRNKLASIQEDNCFMVFDELE